LLATEHDPCKSDISVNSDIFGYPLWSNICSIMVMAMTTKAHHLRTEAVQLARSIEPDALTGDAAAALVEDLVVAEKAIAATRMLVAARVAQTDAWKGQGHRSAADWAAAKAGTSVHHAAEQLTCARRVQRLTATREALRAGELSPSQAIAVADGASADPRAEDRLLESARRDTTAVLRDTAAKVRAAATDDKARQRRVHRERSLRVRTTADGGFCATIRGPGIDGIRLAALLRPHEEEAFRAGRAKGTRDTFENRSYDAFFAMLDNLQTPAEADPPQRPRGGRRGPNRTRRAGRPPGGNNTKVIVRIDHSALIRGHTIAGETCEVAGLGPVPVEAVRALMPDAFIAAVVVKGRDVVNVAHLGRGVNAHQRTAIEALGLRCSNRACNQTVALQIDHRVPWTTEQVTELENQDPLCPRCHNQKTNHGWHLEPGRGPRRFIPPEPARAGPPT
jgi:hypothetical protein